MMLRLVYSAALAAVACLSPAVAQEKTEGQENEQLKVGDAAPDFAWPKPDRAEGSDDTVSLKDLKGEKNVLIAFYPKAFTGGCTKQLCGYRDDFSRFESADTEIVAVSVDEQAESDRFRTEMKMPFVVLGDPGHRVIDAYGVPLKDYGGNTYAQRAVVLVDKEGTVRYIDMDYQIGKDEEPLFAALRELGADTEKENKQEGQ
jgi:peroxiredoxin Q/BCP